jgi:hypothetical protein
VALITSEDIGKDAATWLGNVVGGMLAAAAFLILRAIDRNGRGRG